LTGDALNSSGWWKKRKAHSKPHCAQGGPKNLGDNNNKVGTRMENTALPGRTGKKGKTKANAVK